MNTKVNVQIEKTESGYSASSSELEGIQVRGDTLESLVNALKPILTDYLTQPDDKAKTEAYKPIWEIAQEITSDMTEEEIRNLPADGAEQHDHYIYGIPKRPA